MIWLLVLCVTIALVLGAVCAHLDGKRRDRPFSAGDRVRKIGSSARGTVVDGPEYRSLPGDPPHHTWVRWDNLGLLLERTCELRR